MSPSWDLLIIIGFVFVTAVGVMLGRSKVLSVLFGSYAGYVIASETGQLVFDIIEKTAHSVDISLFLVKIALFLLTIVILVAKTELSGRSEDTGSTLVTIVYGILASGFITTVTLSFLDEAERNKMLEASSLIAKVNDLKVLWIVAPIIFLIFAGFFRGRFSKN
ncbi:MAG: hypothetical protein WDA09_09715 [Bacteriovoracaceae bacterium]